MVGSDDTGIPLVRIWSDPGEQWWWYIPSAGLGIHHGRQWWCVLVETEYLSQSKLILARPECIINLDKLTWFMLWVLYSSLKKLDLFSMASIFRSFVVATASLSSSPWFKQIGSHNPYSLYTSWVHYICLQSILIDTKGIWLFLVMVYTSGMSKQVCQGVLVDIKGIWLFCLWTLLLFNSPISYQRIYQVSWFVQISSYLPSTPKLVVYTTSAAMHPSWSIEVKVYTSSTDWERSWLAVMMVHSLSRAGHSSWSAVMMCPGWNKVPATIQTHPYTS